MECYRRYGPALLRKCERMLGNRDDAEDIVQGLFADLLRKRQIEEELPYLYRAATNRCLNLIRDRKKQRALLEQSWTPERVSRTLLEDQVVGSELLAGLVRRLDRTSAEILVYKYMDDMTQDEIAEMMRLSRRTVGKRLKRISDTARQIADARDGGRP